MDEINLNRDEVIKNSGEIIPPSLGATEISAAQKKQLFEYLVEIIIRTDGDFNNEKS